MASSLRVLRPAVLAVGASKRHVPFVGVCRSLASVSLSSSSTTSTSSPSNATPLWTPCSLQEPVKLNNLAPNKGAVKQVRRVGRGTGSGRGKTCGRGHKGQGQRGTGPRLGFEGGQTPLYLRVPKRGHNKGGHDPLETVTIDRLREFVAMGRLVPPADGSMITMKMLQDAGVVNHIKHGVKLVGKDSYAGSIRSSSSSSNSSSSSSGSVPGLDVPLHMEVSRASESAIAAIEKQGGTVTCCHFNRLAIRAHLKPHKFELLPRRARPKPKKMPFYLDYSKRGFLNPEIQLRNLKLFGKVTSEVHQPHWDLLELSVIDDDDDDEEQGGEARDGSGDKAKV